MKRNNVITFEEAVKQGYEISKPKRPSKKLQSLCDELGPEYHLAILDEVNAIHRVIGSGWDIEIYPYNKSGTKYGITLWNDYGCTTVHTEDDIPADGVGATVELLLHLYAPVDVYPTRYNIGPRPEWGLKKPEN